VPSRRIQRINEIIRDELADLLRREVRDPALGGLISITGVETTTDLRTARVYVSVLGDEEEARATVQRLQNAARFLRGLLGERIRIRHTPELEFRYDSSIARGARIMGLLRQIREEGENRGSGAAPETESAAPDSPASPAEGGDQTRPPS